MNIRIALELFAVCGAAAACGCGRAASGVKLPTTQTAGSSCALPAAWTSGLPADAEIGAIAASSHLGNMYSGDVPNFHVVKPHLLRGAAPTPRGLEKLKKMGVETVIDLRIAPKLVKVERAQAAKLGMRFVNLPMSGDPPTDKEIKTFLDTVAEGDRTRQTVFVHCQHGADRSGTMVGIYRETVDHWSYERAMKEMRKYGFNPRWTKLAATVRRYAPAGHTAL